MKLWKTFDENRVTRAAFLQLTEDDLKELVPLIGERTLVRELLKQSKQVIGTSDIQKHTRSYTSRILHDMYR